MLALGFIFCVYFVFAKPVAAGILVAKQTLPFFLHSFSLEKGYT